MKISIDILDAVVARAVANFPDYTKMVETSPAEFDEEGVETKAAVTKEVVVSTAKENAFSNLEAHVRDWFLQKAGGSISAAMGAETDDTKLGVLVKEGRGLVATSIKVTESVVEVK